MATTFHPFMRLPYEIRCQIWALAVTPRMVHIRTTPDDDWPKKRTCNYALLMPQAELMHVCRESRQLAPYKKAFFTTLPGDAEPRYIWVNFAKDMICTQDEKIEHLVAHETEIQRLRFPIPTGDYGDYWGEYYFHNTSDYFENFTALREVHMASTGGFSFWGYGVGVGPEDNRRLIDLYYLNVNSGLLLTGHQMELMDNWRNDFWGQVYDLENLDMELESAAEYGSFLSLYEMVDELDEEMMKERGFWYLDT